MKNSYAKGYKDAVDEMNKVIHNSILRNNGATTIPDLVNVFNDMQVQLMHMNEKVEELVYEEMSHDAPHAPITVLTINVEKY